MHTYLWLYAYYATFELYHDFFKSTLKCKTDFLTLFSFVSGSINSDIRKYLNTRFPKGGVDHDLQNTIRYTVTHVLTWLTDWLNEHPLSQGW